MLKRLDWHDRHGEGAAEDSDSSGSDTGTHHIQNHLITYSSL